MKILLLVPTMLLAGCATTGGSSSKGSNAPFQGADAVTKRRSEISDAAKTANDECINKLMTKEDAAAFKGASFVVTADSAGKLSVDTLRWSGPETVKACVVNSATKVTVSPMPGPSVSSTWEWNAPGEQGKPPVMPPDLETRVQPLQTQAQAAVEACEQQNLPPEMPADISVAFLVDPAGKTHGPTVINSTAKDGGFDTCVQNLIRGIQFPQASVPEAYPVTFRFHVGRTEKL
jgi:hypothetical protein